MDNMTPKEIVDFQFELMLEEFRDNGIGEFEMPEDVIYDLALEIVLGADATYEDLENYDDDSNAD